MHIDACTRIDGQFAHYQGVVYEIRLLGREMIRSIVAAAVRCADTHYVLTVGFQLYRLRGTRTQVHIERVGHPYRVGLVLLVDTYVHKHKRAVAAVDLQSC